MNKLLTSVLLLGLTLNALCCQVTLSNSRFVGVGDILNYHQNTTDTVEVGVPSAQQQNWDFTHLSETEIWTDTFQAAAFGIFADEFPAANILQRSPNGREDYLEVSNTAILSHGYVQDLLGEQFPVRYQNARIIALSPTNYGDLNETTTAGGFAISLADYPIIDSLLNNLDLGEINGVLDSLRLRSTTNFRQEADAWGVCHIPGGSFDVLRIAQTTEIVTSLEVHVSLGPLSFWIDLANFFDELNFEPLSSENTYAFISPDHKEIIAEVQFSPLGSTNLIRFAAFDPATSTSEIVNTQEQIRVFPNPAQDWVHLQITLPDGNYLLQIYSTEGRIIEIASVSFINGAGQHQLNQQLAGLYFFQLSELGGHSVGAGRFMVRY